MAPNFDLVLASLTKGDVKALRGASHSILEIPPSLPEQLMSMTRLANAEHQKCAAVRAQYSEDLQAFRVMYTEYGRMLRMLEMQERQLAAAEPVIPIGDDATDAEDPDDDDTTAAEYADDDTTAEEEDPDDDDGSDADPTNPFVTGSF